MRVYLVQHGEAMLREQDPERPLTQKGIADVRRMGAFLKPLELAVRTVWHSKKMRAAETAEFLAKAFEAAEGLVPRDGMGPDDDVEGVLAEIARGGDDLMFVGHLPFLAKVAGKLLAGDPAAEPVAFRKGGVVCLARTDSGTWQVAWVLTPDVI